MAARTILRPAAEFFDIIFKQSDRLNLILEDLLQLSKIESGQVLFKQSRVGIRSSVIERTVAMIKPIADKKQHTIELVSFVPRTMCLAESEMKNG